MRLLLIAAASAVLLSGGAAVAQPFEYDYGYAPHYRYDHGWERHRYGNRNSWTLHHGRNPFGSDANGQ